MSIDTELCQLLFNIYKNCKDYYSVNFKIPLPIVKSVGVEGIRMFKNRLRKLIFFLLNP